MRQFFLWIQTICFLYIFHLQFGHPYNLECPKAVHWKLRAKGFCTTNDTNKYFCLCDVRKREYTEGCRGPDWDRKGCKRIISGDLTRGECLSNRYQPFDFWTNGSSDCVYNKTVCAEEGQIISSNGSGYLDRTCRCDFSRGYNYTQPPADLCSCKPSIEDCSCVQKECCEFNDVVALGLNCSKPNHPTLKTKKNLFVQLETDELNTIFVPNARRDGRMYCTVLVSLVLAVLIIGFIVSETPLGLFLCHMDDRTKDVESDDVPDDGKDADLVQGSPSNDQFQTEDTYRQESDVEADDIPDKGKDADGSKSNSQIHEKSPLTREEVNYLRIVHLLYGVACPVVRMVFNDEIRPEKLWQTLDREKRRLQSEIMKADRQKLFIFRITNGRKFKSSDDFDIKIMVQILKEMEIIQIGDNLPLPSDTKKDALLGRIQYFRDVIVLTVDGRLSDEDFKSYWKNISQAILRLSAEHLSKVNQQKLLKVRLLALNPIGKRDAQLQRFVLLTERLPQLILQQVIKEYCYKTFKDDSTVISFLQAEKHHLFHKRKNQSHCCECQNMTFSFILPTEVWNQLYMPSSVTLSKKCECTNATKCYKRFEVNFNFRLDNAHTSLLIPLIMNTPKLLRYMVTRMYNASIRQLLKFEQHSIFHTTESLCEIDCCKCGDESIGKKKHLLTLDDWNDLFVYDEENICNREQCCCKYSVGKNVSFENMNDSLMYKVLRVTGPMLVFDRTNINPLNSFLCWNSDHARFVDSNKVMLKAVKDTDFINTMEERLSKLETFPDDYVQGYISNWILGNISEEKASSSPKTDSVIAFESQGKIAVQHIPISKKARFRFCELRDELISWEPEEMNFIRINHLLFQMICPYLRKKFDSRLSNKIVTITKDLYYEWLDKDNDKTTPNKKSKDKNRRLLRPLTSIQRSRMFHPMQDDEDEDEKTSYCMDLSLMIRILNDWRHSIEGLKEECQLYDHIEIIESIRSAIADSKNGRLDNSEFEEYWDALSKVVIYLDGGEHNDRLCKLKKENIFAGFD